MKKQVFKSHKDAAQDALANFKLHGKGLAFTYEVPKDDGLEFLDISNLTFLKDHVCWMYRQRSRKELMGYDSAHYKTVKRATASLCLQSALQNSCDHSIDENFANQISRLKSAGYPLTIYFYMVDTLL